MPFSKTQFQVKGIPIKKKKKKIQVKGRYIIPQEDPQEKLYIFLGLKVGPRCIELRNSCFFIKVLIFRFFFKENWTK